MDGTAHEVVGADGVTIGLLTAGTGPALLLVHGGMDTLGRWAPMWTSLTERWRVTAMDRRGRRSSGDGDSYTITKEFDDVAAVADHLAEDGGPVDVFGYSFGATCVLGAAAGGAPFRRVALYEPPGPQTAPREWVERVTALIAEGRPGRAMYSFLTERIGLTAERFDELRRAAAGGPDVLSVVSTTMPREAGALTTVDLGGLAVSVTAPVLLLLGARSPPWAGDITGALMATLPNAELVVIPDQGHDALDVAPDVVVTELERYFGRAE